MSYIKQLIDSLFDDETEGNIESFKKLIYLAVNQNKVFAPYALEITNMVCPILQDIEDSSIKILALQLLSQIATNYIQQIPVSTYDFNQIISLLYDDNAQVRKASHYLLLIFIKKYEKIDEIIRGYIEKVKENPDQWKKIQKIIHSFQSLLVIEPRCVTYAQNFRHFDDLLRMLIAFRIHQHNLIQKAADQTVTSFIKNEHAPEILPKLDRVVTAELVQMAEKLSINLKVKQIPKQEESRKYQKKIQKKQDYAKKGEIQILLDSIVNEPDWKIKSDTIQQICKRLQQKENLQLPKDLIDKILDYTYDYNFKICITSMNIISTVISSHPQEASLKLKKIEDIMIEKVCDLKMAVRQIASKILKKIFNNNNKDSAKKIFVKMANCSVVGKEEILSFFQQYFSNAIPYDLTYVLGQISQQLSNENTKIKIKTLDCLVKISISHSNLDQCKFVLQKKLNKVYYDMFLERLRERTSTESKIEKWGDDKNTNKGMTWQAEKSPNMVENTNDKFKTRFQFGVKPEKTNKQIQQDTIYGFKYEQPLILPQNQQQNSKHMMGTSSTSNQTYGFSQSNKMESSVKSKLTKRSVNEYKQPDNFEYEDLEDKKLPFKPKPVKKLNTVEIKQEDSPKLIIKSKQYQSKTILDDIKEEKPVKSVKVSRNQYKQEQQKPKQVAKQPFSIKKTAANKKQGHQIDYKATHYASKQQLAPSDNPKDLLKEVLTGLPKQNDWNKQFESLNGLRRLIKHHDQMQHLLLQNLPTIMPQVLKLVESLRSSLAKNGMITLSQMCEDFKKSMDPFLESIFVKLIRKAQDTNSFIIEELNKCITSLCNYCTHHKIVNVIVSNSQAKAAPIKLKVIYCIDKLLNAKDYSIQFLKQNQKIVGIMGNYVTDGSLEVRNQSKQIFINICCENSKSEVEALFKKVPKEVWDKWKVVLDKQYK